jgi:hypothetical protein
LELQNIENEELCGFASDPNHVILLQVEFIAMWYANQMIFGGYIYSIPADALVNSIIQSSISMITWDSHGG